jgi:predicted XRE-type DNA-binding protein
LRVRSPDPVPPLKAQLARILVERLEGWTQVNAAALLHTDQPRVSDLRHGRLERFSLEQLIRFLSRIGGRIDVSMIWDPRKRWIGDPIRTHWPRAAD